MVGGVLSGWLFKNASPNQGTGYVRSTVNGTVDALAGVTFQSRVYASASAFQFWNMGRPSSAGAYQRRYIAYLAIR